MKNNCFTIADKRLQTAASFVRAGVTVADIGTDHASLPIYLVGNGISPHAVASDINRGPLDAAGKNVRAASLEDKISLVLTDGLEGVEEYDPKDIFILGMGGELIWRIVSDSGFVRDGDIRLILQPMTHSQDLRRGLYSNGFDITDETVVRDRDRIYQIIVARYDGRARTATEAELWLGKLNIARGGELVAELAAGYVKALEKKKQGYAQAGKRDTDAERLCEEFRKIAKGARNDDN